MKCKLLHQYGTYCRFLFRYHCHMDPGVGFDHLFVGVGRLGAEIWIHGGVTMGMMGWL